MRGVFVTLLILLASRDVAGVGRTLAECNTIAKKFANTCSMDGSGNPTVAASVAALSSSNKVCTNVGSCSTSDSAFSGSASSCTAAYKLCVSCRDDAGTVKIRVQSNGVPAICFSSPSAISSFGYDYESIFNPAMDEANPIVSLTTQAEVNSKLCNIQANQNVPSSSGFTSTGTGGLNTAYGIAINNVMLFTSISAEGVDPYFPAAYGSVTDPSSVVESVDNCLGHPQGQGAFHHHSISPCMTDISDSSVSSCGGG